MITLTWGNLRDDNFMKHLGELCAKPLGYDCAMRFAIIGREVKKQKKLCVTTHESILKKLGTPDKEGRGLFNIPDAKMTEYVSEMEKLDAHDFQISVSKFNAIKLSELTELTAEHLILLEPLFLPFEIPVGQEPKYDGPKAVPSKPIEAQPSPAGH